MTMEVLYCLWCSLLLGFAGLWLSSFRYMYMYVDEQPT
jgi:hypothetical protein